MRNGKNSLIFDNNENEVIRIGLYTGSVCIPDRFVYLPFSLKGAVSSSEQLIHFRHNNQIYHKKQEICIGGTEYGCDGNPMKG